METPLLPWEVMSLVLLLNLRERGRITAWFHLGMGKADPGKQEPNTSKSVQGIWSVLLPILFPGTLLGGF